MLRRPVLLAVAPLVGCAAEVPRHEVSIVVYYDEDADGRLASNEAVRLPGVTLSIADRAAVTGDQGRALVTGVEGGSLPVSLDPGTLPPFYRPGRPVTAIVPAAGDVAVPVTLPIGSNVPNTYMAFGDSITSGVGYTDGRSYRARLEKKLAAHFGAARVLDQGSSHSRSNQGAQRIAAVLGEVKPAYTLILYGTNDWNFPACKQVEGCFTVRSLRRILRAVKAAESLPCLATLPPANPGFDHRTPPERNQWVAGIDEEIRALARAEGALIVDLHAAFLAHGDVRSLFTDHVHPSEAGFELIARTFFEAVAGTAPSPPR